MSLLTGIHFVGLFFNIFQGNFFGDIGLVGYGVFGTGLNTSRIAAAEVADVNESIEQFDGADGAGFFTRATEGTYGGRNDDLAIRAQGKGIDGAGHAVALLALLADNRAVNAGFIEV